MSESKIKATKVPGFVKTGTTLRAGRNTPGPHTVDHPDKKANQARQTGKQKKEFHSGVKHPANRANGGITNNA